MDERRLSLSLIAGLFLLQSATAAGTVPARNAELDAAHACLMKGTERLLDEGRPQPDKEARWVWVLKIAGGCEDEINAAADSKDSVRILGEYAYSGISKRHMLRAEANYFVDRLIREHFEPKARETAK